MNTADYLLQAGDDHQPAVITRDRTVTYAELRIASASLAADLMSLGLSPGDRVGLLGENSLFWIAAYLAILKIGAIAVPFPTVATPQDLQAKQRFVGCKAVCIDRRSHRKLSTPFEDGPSLIFDDAVETSGGGVWEAPGAGFDAQQEAALMLTSGTTALPRAVRVTHRNIQANTASIIEYLELTSAERVLVILPFYYCFGTSLLHTHLRVGASLVLCNTFAYPETALDMLEAFECTGLAGVPSTYQTLLRNTSFPQRNFASLRKIQQAGGKLPIVFIRELKAAVPQASIYVMYGQTEATARLSYLPPDLLETKLGSIGRGIPGVKLSVIGESGQAVIPGEVGEIVAWGDNICAGYLNDPQGTAEKFVHGALYTGDLATVDEDGFIYILDRKADFIKSLGHRVSSQEVESHILSISEVVSAAAVGEPDLVQGEAIKVFVTLTKESSLSQEDMLNYCRTHMARHMWPKEIVIVESLPTNSNGKVLKAALRDQTNRILS